MTKGKPDTDDEEQSQKFIETAKKLEADKTGRPFHKAMKSVGQSKGDKKQKHSD